MYKRFTAKNQHFPQILRTFLILFVKFVAFCKLVLGNCFVKQTNNLIELSPSLTCFARSGGTPKLERTLIQCVLIRGMCQLRVRAARRRENGAPSLTDSTSDCAVWVRSWRTKRSGIMRKMSLFMRVPLSPPREMDILVENCPYTSGVRNAGVSGKRGYCI